MEMKNPVRYSLPPRMENPKSPELGRTPGRSIEFPPLGPIRRFRGCCPLLDAVVEDASDVVELDDGLFRRIVRTRGTDEDGSLWRWGDDLTEDAELSPKEELDEFSRSLAELLIDPWKPSEEDVVEQGDAATGMFAAGCEW